MDSQTMKFSVDIHRDFEKATAENIQLKDRILGYQEQIHDLRHSLNVARKAKEGGQAASCEGYIAKLQRRASAALDPFMAGLRALLATRSLVYWDDTVIMISKARGCLRFYGDEGIAFYAAHLHKDMESLDDDSILSLLTPQTTTMHDHNKVNYNEKYSFQNIECNQHLQRDLQKSADDIGHPELLELKGLILKTIKDRKEQIASGAVVFDGFYTARFEEQQKDILGRAEKKNQKDFNPYFGQFEKNSRILCEDKKLC